MSRYRLPVMILLGTLCALSGCRRSPEPRRPAPKGTAASPLTSMDQIARAPEYKPPADGRLTRRQVAMYAEIHRRELELRQRNPATVDLLVARELGYDPREYAWVRDRVLDAEMLRTTRELDRQVAEARRAILTRLRKQRETARSAGERDGIDRKLRELETPSGADRTDPAREANAALLKEISTEISTEAGHGRGQEQDGR